MEPVKIYSVKVSHTPQEYTAKKKVRIPIVVAAIVVLFLAYFLRPKHSDETDKSIAVLPFVDMSPTQDQAYLGDGVAEEILNILSKVKDLKVIARTSSFQFRGEKVDIRDISDKLGVSYVLEGSVRKIDDQMRVTAQLIKSDDGSHIWSENFDRTLDDLFAVQDDIAMAITEQLKLTLGFEVGSDHGTRNSDAYEKYLKGVYIHHNLNSVIASRERFDSSEQLFLRAIQLDSTSSEAHAALSDLYDTGIRMFTDDSTFEGKAKMEAEMALKLDPNSSYALRAKALVSLRKLEYDKSYDLLLQSVRRDPNDVWAFTELSGLLDQLGLHDDALAILNRAISLDPINGKLLTSKGSLLRHIGRYADAMVVFKDASLLNDESSLLEQFVTASITKESNVAEQLYTEIQMQDLDFSDYQVRFMKAMLLAAKGEHKAMELVDDSLSMFLFGMLLGKVTRESVEWWLARFDNNLGTRLSLCCPQPHLFAMDQDLGSDSIHFTMLKRLLEDPRFSSFYEQYKKCVERNKKKYGLENTFLKDIQ